MALQITNQADYATRALLYLAKNSPDRLTPSNVIAEAMNISHMFLSRINSLLTMAGLINTRRGAGGGVILAKPAEEISMLDIITAVDGPIALRRGNSDPRCCDKGDKCPIFQVWDRTSEIIAEELKNVSLQDLVDRCG